jgi:peroxiredoxin
MKDKFEMVEKKIEAFSLPNSRRENVNIKEFIGKKNIVVALLRGLNWPYCRAQVGSFAKDLEQFEQVDTIIYPILVDDLKNAVKMEQKYAKERFPIYYDETKEATKRLHQEFKIFKLGRMPALLIVDKEGIIRYAYYSDSMSDIPKNKILLEVIEKLNS